MKLNLILIITISWIFQACTSEKLDRLSPYVLNNIDYLNVDARFCLLAPNEIREKDKFIFIIDKSSSNKDSPEISDPTGVRRYFPLVDFLNTAQDNLGYTYYSLINFSDSAQTVQTCPTTTTCTDFTDLRTNFKNLIQSEWDKAGPQNPIDIGYTNYLAALDRAFNMIKADAQKEKNNSSVSNTNNGSYIRSNYNIIFISDGEPIVTSTTSSTGLITQQFNPEIKGKIDQLLGLITDVNLKNFIQSVKLNTGYYYSNANVNAENLLSQMAAYGGGSFHKFGVGQNINFRSFVSPIQNIKHSLVDVWVRNKTAMWWDDGKFVRDSDGDGLPDEIELGSGSNPNVPDSDGNGVRDGIEYQVQGTPCKDSSCSRSVTSRNNYASCNGLMPPTNPSGQANPTPDGVNPAGFGTNYFNDIDRDGLNDCEEFVLRADRTELSTNGSMIPDFLQFLNQMTVIAGQNQALFDPDADAVINYNEIKLGSHTKIANNRLLITKTRKVNMIQKDPQNGQDCFNLKVDDVAIVGWNNSIEITLIEHATVNDTKYFVRTAEKLQEGSSTGTIIFNNGDFH